MDTTRADSPLLKATDAIEIDNSYLSRQDQLNKVLQLVKNLNQNAQ
jgi:cytidylate kinase